MSFGLRFAGSMVQHLLPAQLIDAGGAGALIPQKEKEYSLDDLIAGINKNNLHEEADFGLYVFRGQLCGG